MQSLYPKYNLTHTIYCSYIFIIVITVLVIRTKPCKCHKYLIYKNLASLSFRKVCSCLPGSTVLSCETLASNEYYGGSIKQMTFHSKRRLQQRSMVRKAFLSFYSKHRNSYLSQGGHSIKSRIGMLIWTDFLSTQKNDRPKIFKPKKMTEVFSSPHNYPFCTTS